MIFIKDLYLGPGPFDQEPEPQIPGDYTAADQARGWGVPEEQLVAEAPPPAELGVGSSNA